MRSCAVCGRAARLLEENMNGAISVRSAVVCGGAISVRSVVVCGGAIVVGAAVLGLCAQRGQCAQRGRKWV